MYTQFFLYLTFYTTLYLSPNRTLFEIIPMKYLNINLSHNKIFKGGGGVTKLWFYHLCNYAQGYIIWNKCKVNLEF